MANEYDEAVKMARGIVDRERRGYPSPNDDVAPLARAVLAMAKRLERPIRGRVHALSSLLRQIGSGSEPGDHELNEAADLLESLASRVAELEAERRDVETERADVVAMLRLRGADRSADAVEAAMHVGAARKETGR